MIYIWIFFSNITSFHIQLSISINEEFNIKIVDEDTVTNILIKIPREKGSLLYYIKLQMDKEVGFTPNNLK